MCLWVEDNGIGIASENHNRIFGGFERLHAEETYLGTGIGLAVLRRALERMCGQTNVESDLGTGSRFWLELPAPAEF
ncbi:ATP-binding protein [Trichocoleus desertorum AS-A10]|uniref:ATP-binding protein n=1 Tax=Trichocoleus desertorum TaxID=1481672 RepID=UPI00329A6EA9